MTLSKHTAPNWLALAPNWLGDAAMATPALRALGAMVGEGRLTVVGRSSVCQLLAGLPFIDACVTVPSRPRWPQLWRSGRALQEAARAGCVIFPHSIRAALLAWHSGAPQRIGYDRGGRRWLLTHPVAPYRENGLIRPIYMAREYLDLLAPLNAPDPGEGLCLVADPAERRAVNKRLPEGGPRIVIAPGAAFGPAKRWLIDRFAEVADRLSLEHGARCIVVTGPGEEESRERLQDLCRQPIYATDGGRPSIARLKATIAEADLLIGNDSGPRHIAIAFNKPVICIMGPTSPRYTESPWEQGEVLRVKVDCGPCQKGECVTDHRCMTRIEADRVFEAARAWLP